MKDSKQPQRVSDNQLVTIKSQRPQFYSSSDRFTPPNLNNWLTNMLRQKKN